MAKKTPMRGGELMVFVEGTCYPLATSCTLTGTLSMLDPQTKDDSIHQQPFQQMSHRIPLIHHYS